MSPLPALSTRSMVALVAQREMTARLRDRAFIISSIFMFVIVAVSAAVPILLQANSSRPTSTVITVGDAAGRLARQAAALSDQAYAAVERRKSAGSDGGLGAPDPAAGADGGIPQTRLILSQARDVAAAEAGVRSGSADVALVPGVPVVELLAKTTVADDINELVTRAQAAQLLTGALAGTGADPTTVRAALSAAAPQQRLLDADAQRRKLGVVLGLIFSTLLFLTVFTFGLTIAQSVVEEKQSRIVELLVTAVPVRALLLGKVLGNTALALGQIVLLLAGGLAAASIAGQPELVGLLLHSSGWFVGFFLLGFVMLACLWAASGALASRQEDLQSTTVPLQLLVMGPFFASIYVVEPGRWLTILSYLPFSAPMVMPRRVAMGDAGALEALGSAALVVLTAVMIVLIGARLYAGGLLQTRAKAAWREAWSQQG